MSAERAGDWSTLELDIEHVETGLNERCCIVAHLFMVPSGSSKFEQTNVSLLSKLVAAFRQLARLCPPTCLWQGHSAIARQLAGRSARGQRHTSRLEGLASIYPSSSSLSKVVVFRPLAATLHLLVAAHAKVELVEICA